MGTMTFPCPGADSTLDKSFDAVFMRSISFHRDDGQGVTRSTSFPGQRSGPSVLKTFGSGKMLIERSLSFKTRESNPLKTETEFLMRTSDSDDKISTKTTDDQSLETEHLPEDIPRTPVLCNSKHEAAVKLQKVYKSFRTRRKLADCAVLVEQRWWKLLDFALLKTSTFFDIEKPETVFSRWSRARTKAAKVGKGLSKDKKAQKLAVQHWLEAIDPRHRYGHNLHFYYDCWVHYQSRQPFFYWLDVGEGKEVNLEQHCPRSKLQQQCIKYLGPKEREAYEVIVEDGKLLYKQSGQVLDTREGHKNLKWIFVLSTSKTLYVGQKMKGTFQHSSFLAGGATSAAGRLVVENGVLKAVWPHSGHYRPTDENFQEFVSFLKDNNVDLTDVKKSPTDEDDESETRCDGALRSSISELDLTRCTENTCAADINQQEVSAEGGNSAAEPTGSHCFDMSNGSGQSGFFAGLQNVDEKAKNISAFDRLYTQCVQNLFREFEPDSEEESEDTSSCETETSIDESKPIEDLGSCTSSTEFHLEGQGTGKEIETCDQDHVYQKHNLFEEGKDGDDDDDHDDDHPRVPREAILHRINSKKGMKSYQLGKQLSFKWTTGAGPRIGCVRDYPSELQFHALEKVNLSPRHARTSAANASPGCTGLSS